jgi:hypothetical protein
MATRFVITYHALCRFVERYERVGELEPDQYRSFLSAQLQQAVLFAVQPHHDQFLLLPCGCVAAVVWHKGAGFVKTVLTQRQALRVDGPWTPSRRAAA